MQKIIFPLAALFLILFSFQTTRAQGCSDAGFCTLSSFKPAGPAQNEPLDNQVRLGLSFGAADHDITVMGTFFEYSRQISDKWSAEAKITTLYQQNENVTAFGFSDVYLYANYAINDHFRFTLGAKLPMSDGNRLIDNTVVPMDFQSSLGTIDVLAGVAYKYNKLHVVMAFQQPVRQNNNQFLSENLVGNSVFNGFQSTRLFNRSGDVLLRVSYAFQLDSKLQLTPAILPIYHFANDEYTNDAGRQVVIEGSQGVTLNANLFLDYAINDMHALQLNAGAPLLIRDTRPDGLTRTYIAALEYKFRF